MKTIKVSKATPIQLDWLVAKCEGYTNLRRNPHRFAQQLIMNRGGTIKNLGELNYSSDLAQGGPLIEKELINLITTAGYPWRATVYMGGGVWIDQEGPTPLIAAMRCYVASKMGDVVEVPEELE